MADRPTVAALCGSLRRESWNRTLLSATAALAAPRLAITEVPIRDLPHFDEDLERDPWPPQVLAVGEAVRRADAVMIVTPEYNAGIPGPLKNAIDWLSRATPAGGAPIAGKPVAILGASPGMLGTARAQSQLRLILQNLQLPVLPGPNVFVSNAPSRFGADGSITDEATRAMVETMLDRFVAWIAQVGGEAAA